MGNQQLIMANDKDRLEDGSSNITTDTEQDSFPQQIRTKGMNGIDKVGISDSDEKRVLCVSSNGKGCKTDKGKKEKSQNQSAPENPYYMHQELQNDEKNQNLPANSSTQKNPMMSSAINTILVRSQVQHSVDGDQRKGRKRITYFDYSSIHYKNMDIFTACANGDLPVVALLLNRILYSQHAPLFRQCRQHHSQKSPPKIQSISEIISLNDDQKNNPLHYAALSNNEELIELLIETDKLHRNDSSNQYEGEDLVHVQNEDGETALLRAALVGSLPVIRVSYSFFVFQSKIFSSGLCS